MSYSIHRILSALLLLSAGGSAAGQGVPSTIQGERLPQGALARFGTARLRAGDGRHVEGVVLLRGGKRLVTLAGSILTLWDTETGEPLRTTAPAGKRTSRMWGLPTPRFGERFKRAPFHSTTLALSADGKSLAVLAESGLYLGPADLDGPFASVRLDDALAGEGLAAIAFASGPGPLVMLGAHGRVGLFAPGKDGRARSFSSGLDTGTFLAVSDGVIAVGSQKYAAGKSRSRVALIDLAEQKVTQNIEAPSLWGLAAAGRYLAIGDYLKKDVRPHPALIALWDLSKGKEVARCELKESPSMGLALSPDGERAIVSSSFPARVHLWNLKSGKRVGGGPLAENSRTILSFAPDGKTFVTAYEPRIVRLWDTVTGRPLDRAAGHVGPVTALRYLPDSTGLLSAGEDGVVIQWDLKKRAEARRLSHTFGQVNALAVSADGKRLVSAGWGGVREWDLADGKGRVLFASSPADGRVSSLALAPGGKWIALGYNRHAEIRLHEFRAGATPRVLKAESKIRFATPFQVRDLAFASDKLLVARNQSRQLRIWDTARGELLHEIDVGSLKYPGLAISPDGQEAITPYERISDVKDRTGLGFWNLETGKLTGRIRLGETKFTAVAYLPGGKTLAMGDMAGRVYLWDLERSRLLASFAGHRGPVTALAVAPDGRTLASGGRDTQILLWNAHASRGD